MNCAAASTVTTSMRSPPPVAPSEVSPDTELNLPWERPVRQTADSAHTGANSGTWIPIVLDVEGVQELRAELDIYPVANPESLHQREVDLVEHRAHRGDATRIAIGPGRRREDTRIEPLALGWM